MERKPVLLDRWGRPVQRSVLKEEVSAATMGSVRSPISGYPGDGLDPVRLANILREADQGDPVRYLELAETIEERDPHYLGVLGTRRRSVSQIEVTVEAADESSEAEAQAQMVRDWLKRDELGEEIFDILDGIGKGYSFTEIIWDSSTGQWEPQRLEWRDPRWFRFDRTDLKTPVKLDGDGQEVPLDPFKFIVAQLKAKSGLALRSGLARVAAWGWMFKAYTQRDWAIFSQTYGQPLRVGKWQTGASEEDKNTLFRAVANIAGDCAAIIPESMQIDFVESKNLGAASDLYEKRADWLDRQISKAVLGQTTTTDAVSGGHAVSQEHRQVQEDIERADAKALAGILNRDLIRPWIDLEHGPQRAYPRLVIARPEQEDLKQLSDALGKLVPLGFRVDQEEMRGKFGLKTPEKGAEILAPAAVQPVAPEAPGQTSPIKHFSGPIKRVSPAPGPGTPELQQEAPEGRSAAPGVPDRIAAQLAEEASPAVGDILARIEAMLEVAGSLEEFRDTLMMAFPEIDAPGLESMLGLALTAAGAAGRIEVVEEEEDD